MTRLLFVTHPQAVSGAPGGLQLCTDEFLRAFKCGGFDVSVFQIEHDRTLSNRVRRRLVADPYPRQWRPQAVAEIAGAATQDHASAVCLNLVNLAPLAVSLRPLLPKSCRVILLSHGLESVDYLHTVPTTSWSRAQAHDLGRRLLQERAHRAAVDHVLTLTPFEAEIERWLGARTVTAVPRTVAPAAPLDWQPDARRLGFVGTLDHPPTWHGLVECLSAIAPIAPAGLEVRLVGAPADLGRSLADRFAFVRYLGALPETALRDEAASWSAFLHPLFCWARGCSTKLAVALAWRIPVVTTPAGARGYSWRSGEIPTADTPAAFAELACSMTDRAAAAAARRETIEAARTSPTLDDVGRLLRDALLPVRPAGCPVAS